jgi:molybdopterin synthase catalytic subunit
MSVSVQQQPFDVGAEIAALTAGNRSIGAVASFVGLVRDIYAGHAGSNGPEAITSMTLEHYPGMTERALEDIVAEAHSRWQLMAVRVIHRFGPLAPGDGIVLVIVAAAHRGEAFAACEFIMDFLKTRAPFWKKEAGAAGPDSARWVDARDSDDSAAERWEKR